MTSYLPGPDWRCSAYFYAARAGLVSVPQAPGDLEFLRELGLRAALLARWEGLPRMTIPEGPYPAVLLWPEVIWSTVADAMANYAAEHGDYGHSGDPARESADGDPQGYGDPPWAGFSREDGEPPHPEWDPDEPVPPWCPLPQGDQALRDIGY